jgi:hypothetical protein
MYDADAPSVSHMHRVNPENTISSSLVHVKLSPALSTSELGNVVPAYRTPLIVKKSKSVLSV